MTPRASKTRRKGKSVVGGARAVLRRFKYGRELYLRVLVLALLVGMNWSGLFAVGATVAYYADAETSSGNTQSAGSLDFSLDPDEWMPVGKEDSLLPGDTVSRTVGILDNGTIGFQYTASSVKTAGNDVFCDALVLDARQDGVSRYTGALMGFLAGPFVFAAPEKWIFDVTLPLGAPNVEGMSCEFTFVFNGWQEGFPASSGFRDTEEVENILEAASSATASTSPIADAYVHQAGPDSEHGLDSEFDIKSFKGGLNKRAFARFGFHLPSDVSILSSTLRFFMKAAPAASRTYAAARALASWTEAGINWNNQPATSSPPTASAPTGTSNNVWLSWDVTPDVASFVDKTLPNFGWEVHDTLENFATVQEALFIARENNDDNKRPVLEIKFGAPAATTTHLVVNEVYADVGSGKGSEGTNEWVEIYNPTAAAVDVKDWKICDSGTCDTFSTTSPSILIPSHGFAVVTPNVSTWPKWATPGGTVKIVLPGNSDIGGGLANGGDAVILKNSADAEVDAMSYGSNTSKLNPSAPVSGDGDSLARIVKGYDTDSAQDWIINATPNPGTNPSQDGVEVMRFTSEGVEVAASGEGLKPLDTSAAEPDESEDDLAIEDSIIGETAIGEATSTEPIASDAAALLQPQDVATSSAPAALETPSAEDGALFSSSTPTVVAASTPPSSATETDSAATSTDSASAPTEPSESGPTQGPAAVIPDTPASTGESGQGAADDLAGATESNAAPAEPTPPEANVAAPENEPAVTPEPTAAPDPSSAPDPAPAPGAPDGPPSGEPSRTSPPEASGGNGDASANTGGDSGAPPESNGAANEE